MFKVCFFGKMINKVLRGDDMGGGAELQIALVARALAQDGMSVKIIDTQASKSCVHQRNLAIEAIPNWNRGMRGIRFFTHRISNLVRCLRATQANVYYARGFSYLFLFPLYVAKITGAKFVLAVAHDTDLMKFRDRYRIMYRRNASVWSWMSTIIPNEIASSILVKGADILLVQHEMQRQLARSRGKCAIKLNNILGDNVLRVQRKIERRHNIIVGALSARKGLGVLLPLIGELKHVVFEFVGDATDIEGERVKDNLRQYPNVILHGALDRQKTLEQIAGAKALVNTSRAEGFPNTFLEAWALETPVISLFVDPGGVIKSNHLGYACDGDLKRFKELLLLDKYDWDGAHARQYVVDHHMPQQVVRFFRSIASGETLQTQPADP